MHVPNVKNVNLGKRHKKKHYFKVGDPIVFKWWGERDYGFVSQLTKNKEGYAESNHVMKNGILIGCHHGMGIKEINFIHLIFMNKAIFITAHNREKIFFNTLKKLKKCSG